MSKCHVCSFQNEPEAEYCEECGVRIGGLAPPLPPICAPQPSPLPAVDRPPPMAAAALRPPPMAVISPAPVGTVAEMAAQAPVPAAPAMHPTRPEEFHQVVEVRCPSCDTRVEGAVNFCPGCGMRLVAGGEALAKPRDVIRLRMVSGKDKDRLFEIDKNEVRMGRLNENDIRLEADGYVSGKHTRVVKQGDEYFVEDMGSTNGTFLRVRRLTKITPGDEIKVGQSIFRLE